jgi:hypothetical protein
MTTTNGLVLHSRHLANDQAIHGVHRKLIIAEVPAGAESVIGKELDGLTLTVDGDYVCLIPTAGLTAISVSVTATLTSMTAEAEGPDELALFDPRATDVASAVALNSSADDGALSTGVRKVSTLALTGALYCRYTLVLAGSPTSVAVTEAEYVGA